jgi:uncharacterized protein
MRLSARERADLYALIAPYEANETVQSMDAYVQHGSTSTLDHCRNVCEASWWITRRLRMRVNESALAVGALLHDFYLYDWHGSGWRHNYRHAELARRNAVSYFGADKATQAVIRNHMWPIGITHVPRTREAIIVSLADKYVTLHEVLLQRHGKRSACG